MLAIVLVLVTVAGAGVAALVMGMVLEVSRLEARISQLESHDS